MNITLLDSANLLNSGECHLLDPISNLGSLVCHEYSTPAEIIEKAQTADVLIVNKLQMPHEIISKLTQTKLICKAGTGVDNIDLGAAKKAGITVTNCPNYSTNMVAQWTMMQLLALSANVVNYDREVKQGRWQASQYQYPVNELKGKTLGIIGFGAIGQYIAKLGQAFEMQILVHSGYPSDIDNIEFVDLETLAEISDFISLHRALTPASEKMINSGFLKSMKPTAYLINTGRAGLIDEADLIEALKHKEIAGAAMDVFWQEPPEHDHPFYQMDNVLITPHIAWASTETKQHLFQMIADNIQAYINGEPQHVVIAH